MITLAQLLTPDSEDVYLQWCLDTLGSLRFNVTSWQTGSRQRTIVQLFAKLGADIHKLIAALAAAGFNRLATGDGLTAFSASRYANVRYPATRTTGKLVLSDDASVGPVTIAVGAYVYKDNVYGYTYRNTSGGTLALDGTLTIDIQAEVAGSSRNVGNGTIVDQVTPIAGVSCTNPAQAGTATWITTSGTDQESDVDLRIRNEAKWPTLAIGSEPADAYIGWARSAAAGITRVVVDDTNPDGPGTLDVYVAGPSGVAAGADVTAAQALITAEQPETAVATAVAADDMAQAFTATVYVSAEFFTSGIIQAAKKAEIEAALSAYVNGLDIGGTVLPAPDGDGVTGYCVATEWQGAVTAVEGVRGLGSPSPSANVEILGDHTGLAYAVMVGTPTFSYVAMP